MTVAWVPKSLGSGLDGGRLWNSFLWLEGQRIPFGSAGGTVCFALPETLPGQGWIGEFRLDEHGPSLFARVREFPFRQLFEVELDVAGLATLPGGLRDALRDGMFEYVLDLLRTHPRLQPRLVAQGQPESFPALSASDMQWFEVRLADTDGCEISLDVACPRSLAVRIVESGAALVPSTDNLIADQIAIPAYFTLGRVSLSLAEFASIETGAVAVLPARDESNVSVRIEDQLFDFVRTEEGCRCLGERMIAEWDVRPKGNGKRTMQQEAEGEPSQAEEPTLRIDEINVAIDFDIGRAMIPVSQLRSWKTGVVVPLDPPAPGDGLEVTIKVNGATIGMGEVVRIDERLAVRITRLSTSD